MQQAARIQMISRLQSDGFTPEESVYIVNHFAMALDQEYIDNRPAMIRAPNGEVRVVEATMADIVSELRPDLMVDEDGDSFPSSDEISAGIRHMKAENN